MKRILFTTIFVLIAGFFISYSINNLEIDGTGPISKVGEKNAFAKTNNLKYDLSSIVILTRAIAYINNYYYDPARIKPVEMLKKSLKEIARSVPAVMININKDKKDVLVQIEDEKKNFSYKEVDALWDIPYILSDIFTFIQPHVKSEKIDPKKVEYAAINGMLDTLDPHSVMMPPRLYSELKVSTTGSFGGLGIQIGIRDGGKLTIISPIEGTPAWRAGLKALDKIARIEDQSTVNMTLEEAVGMMRGEPGTPCKISIMREGFTEPRTYTIVRDIIKVQSVTSKLMPDNTGYVRLKNFQANTPEDMRKALLDMKKRGGLKRVILDLRGNAGGLLEAAVKVADVFLDSGTIVTTVGASNQMKDSRDASFLGTQQNLPMAVLVNSSSASAAEIVAGALKNNNRATVIGDRTFGKGSVQIIYDMDDGSALKLTVAQYLTPGDVSIQSVGIVPDLHLLPVYIEDDMIDFFDSEATRRENTLDKHLDHESTIQEKSFEILGYLYDKERDEYDPEDGKVERTYTQDFVTQFAYKFLKNLGSTSRREIMLQRSVKLLKDTAKEEDKKIVKKLAHYKIDWSSNSKPKSEAKATVEVKIAPEGFLPAGEKSTITISVKNEGKDAFSRLRLASNSDYYLFDRMEFFFGKIAPGETKSFDFEVDAPKDVLTRFDEVSFKFKGEHDFVPKEFKHTFKAVARPRPEFAYSYSINDDKGNGDGRIQRGETIEMQVNIFNVGDGPVEEGLALLRNEDNLKGIFITDGRFEFEPIGPDEVASVNFSFKVRNELKKDNFPISMTFMDNKMREVLTETLTFDIEPELKAEPVKSGNLTKVNLGSEIFGSTQNLSSLVAKVEADALLPVLATTGGWAKVLYSPDHKGWIKKDTKFNLLTEGEKGTAKVIYSHRPPQVEITQPQTPALVNSEYALISGKATDYDCVCDLYIFNNGEKVYYKSNRLNPGGKELDFSTKIELEEGINRIEIFARQDQDLRGMETLIILKPKVSKVEISAEK